MSIPMMHRTTPITEMISPGRWIGCGGVFWTEVAIIHSIVFCSVDIVTPSGG